MSEENSNGASGASGGTSVPSGEQVKETSSIDRSDSTAPRGRDRPGFEPRPDFLAALLNMGIEKETALRALYHTKNHSAEMAIAWIYENPAVDDVSESSEDEEEDYFKMVFVLNTELNMGLGKKCAQVAHAALGLFKLMCESQDKYGEMLLSWEQYGETKIVLKGESTQQLMSLAQRAQEHDLPNYLVQDAGRTQIAPGSVTVLGIMGRVDLVDQVTGSLKLL